MQGSPASLTWEEKYFSFSNLAFRYVAKSNVIPHAVTQLHQCGTCCIPWGSFGLLRPPRSKETLLPQGMSYLLPWVNLDLQQWYRWHKSAFCEGESDSLRGLGFTEHCCHQTCPLYVPGPPPSPLSSSFHLPLPHSTSPLPYPYTALPAVAGAGSSNQVTYSGGVIFDWASTLVSSILNIMGHNQ